MKTLFITPKGVYEVIKTKTLSAHGDKKHGATYNFQITVKEYKPKK